VDGLVLFDRWRADGLTWKEGYGREGIGNGRDSRQEVEDDELVPSLADSEAPEVPVRPLAAALLPVDPLAEESSLPAVGIRPPKARLLSWITTGWRSRAIRV
jgi:hypothetical protein